MISYVPIELMKVPSMIGESRTSPGQVNQCIHTGRLLRDKVHASAAFEDSVLID